MREFITGLMTAMVAVPVFVGLLQEKPAPKIDVPAAVKSAIDDRFPGAQLLKAGEEEEDGKVSYEAVLNVKIEATFAADGSLINEEQKTTVKAIPADVMKGLAASKYQKATIKGVERMIRGGSPTLFYEFAGTLDDRKIEFIIDSNGKVVAEEGADEEDEEHADDKPKKNG
jgi:Putative beta-lactamase-inhibitor-like, PepSY-like